MSSGKRSSYELTAPAGEERPLSFYDNLTTGSSSGTKIIQIPDIQFKFDDDIQVTTDPRRSTLMSNAKSDFFGLSKAAAAAAGCLDNVIDTVDASRDEADESHKLVPDQDRRTPPITIIPSAAAASSSSPTSTASTVPARSTGSTEDSPGTNSRPISSHRNITIKLPDAGTPSEAVYMTTTVPQNFAKNTSTLIGRHKPTRSSLRHSRMLVVNKNFHQRFPKGNSLNLKHIRLSRTLMVLKILIGAILTVVGMTIIVWSPNTHTKDNPYWAGLILILSGSLFLILFDFKRRPANRLRENFYNFLRVNALVLLLLTIFFTMLAFIYALIHTTNLTSEHLRCEPEYRFNVNSSSCVCLIDGRAVASSAASELRSVDDQLDDADDDGRGNATSSSTIAAILSGLDLRRAAEQAENEGLIRLEYRDFNCSEVLSIWYYVTLGSTILNSVGCLLAAGFLVIYGVECQRREQELKYFSVRTNSNGNGTKMAERKGEGGTAEAVQDTGGGAGRGDKLDVDQETSNQPLDKPSNVNVTESIDVKNTEA